MRVFTSAGREDYCSWADDRKMLRRVNRITDEHRLVYRRAGEDLLIVQARYHY